MKWRFIVPLALVAELLTFSPTQANAVAKGLPCKKLNQQALVSGKLFTCVRSGTKYVWNSGVLFKKKPAPLASPSPSRSPSPSPIPSTTSSASPTPATAPTEVASSSPSATPAPAFSEPAQPTSFSDLLEKASGVSYWAWKKSSIVLQAAPSHPVELVQEVGPNTQMMNADPNAAIALTARLYSAFAIPKRVYAIYFNSADVAWAQQKFNEVAYRPTGREAANNCATPATCWGGSSEIDLKGNAILLMALRSPDLKDSNHTTGTLESHEFTHAIQGSQFVGTAKEANSYCCTKAYMPWWLVEGGAEFSQAAAIFNGSFNDYIQERRSDTGSLKGDATITTSWLETFLKPASISDWSKYDNWRLYDVGFMASEIMASLKGSDSVIQLFKDVAGGKSYDEAFQGIFGISWSDAVPIMAKTIHSMIMES